MKYITITTLTVLLSTTSFAQTAIQIASSNESIESTGPSGSPWNHNAQAPGGFEAYAIDSFTFSPSDFGLATVTALSVIEISYMQSNAFFTTGGPLSFFVSFDTTVGGGDYSGLSHSSSGAGIDDAQFSDSPSTQGIGSGTFTETADGDVDTYALSFGGALETSLLNAINNSDPFSILMGVSSGSTAATYAGLESFDYVINGGSEPDSKRTNLSLTAVPEPEMYGALVGLLALGLAVSRRRRRS